MALNRIYSSCKRKSPSPVKKLNTVRSKDSLLKTPKLSQEKMKRRNIAKTVRTEQVDHPSSLHQLKIPQPVVQAKSLIANQEILYRSNPQKNYKELFSQFSNGSKLPKRRFKRMHQ